MKLKKEIPVYNIGDTVTILDDLSLRTLKVNGDSIGDASVNNVMKLRQGSKHIIDHIGTFGYYTISDCLYNWTANMFKESYEFEEELITEPYVGMYLYHRYNLTGSDYLFRIYELEDDRFKTSYVDGVRSYEGLQIDLTFNEKPDRQNMTSSNNKSIKNGITYFGMDLYIPTNEELYAKWGVTNKTNCTEESLIEGTLPIPNLFEYSKYPIVKLTGIRTNGNSYSGYVFKLKDGMYVSYNGIKYENIKLSAVFSNKTINSKDTKELILNWGKAKIKSFEESVALFGHKTRKKLMFEASNNKPSKIFKIKNITFNCEKDGKYYHVVEVNDGSLNLKFLLNDVEFILPNVNNYVLPKDRTIILKSECKVIKDKLLPVSRGTAVKVLKMYNRHTPLKGASTYDKNTICVVSNGTNKTFECKVKQLKKI